MKICQNRKRKIRPLRLTFNDIEKKRHVLESLQEIINAAKGGKYKYMFVFFHHDLTWKQREIAKAKRASRSAAKAHVEVGTLRGQGPRGQTFRRT